MTLKNSWILNTVLWKLGADRHCHSWVTSACLFGRGQPYWQLVRHFAMGCQLAVSDPRWRVAGLFWAPGSLFSRMPDLITWVEATVKVHYRSRPLLLSVTCYRQWFNHAGSNQMCVWDDWGAGGPLRCKMLACFLSTSFKMDDGLIAVIIVLLTACR